MDTLCGTHNDIVDGIIAESCDANEDTINCFVDEYLDTVRSECNILYDTKQEMPSDFVPYCRKIRMNDVPDENNPVEISNAFLPYIGNITTEGAQDMYEQNDVRVEIPEWWSRLDSENDDCLILKDCEVRVDKIDNTSYNENMQVKNTNIPASEITPCDSSSSNLIIKRAEENINNIQTHSYNPFLHVSMNKEIKEFVKNKRLQEKQYEQHVSEMCENDVQKRDYHEISKAESPFLYASMNHVIQKHIVAKIEAKKNENVEDVNIQYVPSSDIAQTQNISSVEHEMNCDMKGICKNETLNKEIRGSIVHKEDPKWWRCLDSENDDGILKDCEVPVPKPSVSDEAPSVSGDAQGIFRKPFSANHTEEAVLPSKDDGELNSKAERETVVPKTRNRIGVGDSLRKPHLAHKRYTEEKRSRKIGYGNDQHIEHTRSHRDPVPDSNDHNKLSHNHERERKESNFEISKFNAPSDIEHRKYNNDALLSNKDGKKRNNDATVARKCSKRNPSNPSIENHDSFEREVNCDTNDSGKKGLVEIHIRIDKGNTAGNAMNDPKGSRYNCATEHGKDISEARQNIPSLEDTQTTDVIIGEEKQTFIQKMVPRAEQPLLSEYQRHIETPEKIESKALNDGVINGVDDTCKFETNSSDNKWNYKRFTKQENNTKLHDNTLDLKYSTYKDYIDKTKTSFLGEQQQNTIRAQACRQHMLADPSVARADEPEPWTGSTNACSTEVQQNLGADLKTNQVAHSEKALGGGVGHIIPENKREYDYFENDPPAVSNEQTSNKTTPEYGPSFENQYIEDRSSTRKHKQRKSSLENDQIPKDVESPLPFIQPSKRDRKTPVCSRRSQSYERPPHCNMVSSKTNFIIRRSRSTSVKDNKRDTNQSKELKTPNNDNKGDGKYITKPPIQTPRNDIKSHKVQISNISERKNSSKIKYNSAAVSYGKLKSPDNRTKVSKEGIQTQYKDSNIPYDKTPRRFNNPVRTRSFATCPMPMSLQCDTPQTHVASNSNASIVEEYLYRCLEKRHATVDTLSNHSTPQMSDNDVVEWVVHNHAGVATCGAAETMTYGNNKGKTLSATRGMGYNTIDHSEFQNNNQDDRETIDNYCQKQQYVGDSTDTLTEKVTSRNGDNKEHMSANGIPHVDNDSPPVHVDESQRTKCNENSQSVNGCPNKDVDGNITLGNRIEQTLEFERKDNDADIINIKNPFLYVSMNPKIQNHVLNKRKLGGNKNTDDTLQSTVTNTKTPYNKSRCSNGYERNVNRGMQFNRRSQSCGRPNNHCYGETPSYRSRRSCSSSSKNRNVYSSTYNTSDAHFDPFSIAELSRTAKATESTRMANWHPANDSLKKPSPVRIGTPRKQRNVRSSKENTPGTHFGSPERRLYIDELSNIAKSTEKARMTKWRPRNTRPNKPDPSVLIDCSGFNTRDRQRDNETTLIKDKEVPNKCKIVIQSNDNIAQVFPVGVSDNIDDLIKQTVTMPRDECEPPRMTTPTIPLSSPPESSKPGILSRWNPLKLFSSPTKKIECLNKCHVDENCELRCDTADVLESNPTSCRLEVIDSTNTGNTKYTWERRAEMLRKERKEKLKSTWLKQAEKLKQAQTHEEHNQLESPEINTTHHESERNGQVHPLESNITTMPCASPPQTSLWSMLSPLNIMRRKGREDCGAVDDTTTQEHVEVCDVTIKEERNESVSNGCSTNLSKEFENNPDVNIKLCNTVSDQNRVSSVSPDVNKEHTGVNVGWQADVVRLKEERKERLRHVRILKLCNGFENNNVALKSNTLSTITYEQTAENMKQVSSLSADFKGEGSVENTWMKRAERLRQERQDKLKATWLDISQKRKGEKIKTNI